MSFRLKKPKKNQQDQIKYRVENGKLKDILRVHDLEKIYVIDESQEDSTNQKLFDQLDVEKIICDFCLFGKNLSIYSVE